MLKVDGPSMDDGWENRPFNNMIGTDSIGNGVVWKAKC